MLVGACEKCGSAICKICRALRHVPALDVALVPHLDLRPNGLSIAKGDLGLLVELVPGCVVVREGGQLDDAAGDS